MAAAANDANGEGAESAGQEPVPGPLLDPAALKDGIRQLLSQEASPKTAAMNQETCTL